MSINIQNLLLRLIFPISIIVDLINGFCHHRLGVSIPIGVLLRSIILFLLFYSIKSIHHTIGKSYLMIVFIVYIICLFSWVINAQINILTDISVDIGVELNVFVRILYVFLLIIYMCGINDSLRKDIEILILNYGFFIGTCITISYITGFGQNSYGENYGFGTKSFFIAGNDIGITLLYSGIIASIQTFSNFKYKTLIKYIIIIIGCVLIGSRVGMLGAGLLLCISLLYYIFYFHPQTSTAKLYKKLTVFFAIPIASYFVGVAVVELISIFDQYTIDRLSLDSILSARDNFIENAKEYISSLTGLSWLIGNGRGVYANIIASDLNKGLELKIAEADYFDIIGSFGFVLGWALLFPFIIFTLQSINQFIKHKNYYNFCIVFVTMSFVFIGYTAGHCIANVMVAPIYAYMISRVHIARKYINTYIKH